MLPSFGFAEFLLLAIVALIVVGPKDLPRMMHAMGQFANKARRMASEFRASFDEIAKQAQIDELREEIETIKRENVVAKAVEELKDVEGDINEAIMRKTTNSNDQSNKSSESEDKVAKPNNPKRKKPKTSTRNSTKDTTKKETKHSVERNVAHSPKKKISKSNANSETDSNNETLGVAQPASLRKPSNVRSNSKQTPSRAKAKTISPKTNRNTTTQTKKNSSKKTSLSPTTKQKQ